LTFLKKKNVFRKVLGHKKGFFSRRFRPKWVKHFEKLAKMK